MLAVRTVNAVGLQFLRRILPYSFTPAPATILEKGTLKGSNISYLAL